MISLNKKIIVVLMLSALMIVSCKKGFFYKGIDDDPTQLKNGSPKLLLPSVIMAGGYELGGDESRFPTIFMQQVTGAGNQSYAAYTYNISPDDIDNMWTYGFYVGMMNNTYDLINVSNKLNQKYYHAIGQIVMSNFLMRATDLWGDIPYSGAFEGNKSKNIAYESQQAIYDTIFLYLNNAIAEIKEGDDGASLPGEEDYLYANSSINVQMGHWVKFAHSLKARGFIHLVKQNTAYYDSAIAEIPNSFSSQDDNAIVPFNATNQNPIYQFNDQRGGDILYNGTLQDLMINAKDPRVSVYFADKGAVGDFYGDISSPVAIMTYEEVKFIEAEAELHKGEKAKAADAYNSAVKAALQRTVGNTAYAATVAKTENDITLSDIMTQKYIALFLNPECWSDWRRTNIPSLKTTKGSTLGEVPRVLIYPSSEVKYNSNTPKNQTLKSRVWWDK